MLRTRLRFLLFICLVLALMITGQAGAVLGAPPQSVTLSYFRGESVADGARLEWQTATELDTAGFRILRATQASGPFEALSAIGLVAAQGGPTNGATYEVVDTTAVSGQTYWYRLLEVEYSSAEHVLHTFSLPIGGEPTATVEAVATNEDDNNDNDGPADGNDTTATGTPSPSPSATASSATNTPRAATATSTVSSQASPTPVEDTDSVVASRPSGNGAEAAGETTNIQPTAVAQVTEAYPDPLPAESTPEAGYPADNENGEELEETPVLTVTEESYPLSGSGNGITPARPAESGENMVGGNAETADATETQPQQSGSLSRILLWLGFVAALIIFIAGAFFSILLSTRKQRQDLS